MNHKKLAKEALRLIGDSIQVECNLNAVRTDLRLWMRHERKKRNRSLRSVAYHMGCSASELGRLETGHRRLKLKWYEKFCDALNIH